MRATAPSPRAVLALGLLVVVLLSGCAGQASSKNEFSKNSVNTQSFQDADPDEAGEIVGRVVDDEFQPLGGAVVRIAGTEARTETTGDGIFLFAGVPPRTYTLSFTKSGYESKNQSVVLTPQQRITMEIMLAQVTDTSPFVDEGFVFRGKINCSGRVNATGVNSNPECGAVNDQTDVLRLRFVELLPDVRWLLIEVDWQAAIPVVNDKLTLALRPYQGESWRQVAGPSPIKVLLGPNEFGQILNATQKNYPRYGGQLQVIMFPGEAANPNGVGVGATVQQDFTIYATAWYRMDPPEGYTRLPRP